MKVSLDLQYQYHLYLAEWQQSLPAVEQLHDTFAVLQLDVESFTSKIEEGMSQKTTSFITNGDILSYFLMMSGIYFAIQVVFYMYVKSKILRKVWDVSRNLMYNVHLLYSCILRSDDI